MKFPILKDKITIKVSCERNTRYIDAYLPKLGISRMLSEINYPIGQEDKAIDELGDMLTKDLISAMHYDELLIFNEKIWEQLNEVKRYINPTVSGIEAVTELEQTLSLLYNMLKGESQ